MTNHCFNNAIIKIFQQREESLFLCLPVQGGAPMGGQVSLQLGQRGEIQTTLHTYVLLAFLVLQLMGTKLTGVSKTSATHTAAGEADKECER